MKKLIFSILILILFTTFVYAQDVWVDGYYRSDGTYVRGHWRSAPNQYRWDNYGPSQSDYDRYNPYGRDADGDGIPNYMDYDDDNDGIGDDWDSSQY